MDIGIHYMNLRTDWLAGWLCVYLTNWLSSSMIQTRWKIYCGSSDEIIPCFYRTSWFIAVFTKACCLVWSNPEPLEFSPHRYILFLCDPLYVALLYRVSQEECARLREGVPYVKVYRYNPKHLCPKLNRYGDNGQRSLKLWQLLHTYWLPNTY